jgi:hypothetical protein
VETWTTDLATAIDDLEARARQPVSDPVAGQMQDALQVVVTALRHVKRGLDDVARQAEQAEALARE